MRQILFIASAVVHPWTLPFISCGPNPQLQPHMADLRQLNYLIPLEHTVNGICMTVQIHFKFIGERNTVGVPCGRIWNNTPQNIIVQWQTGHHVGYYGPKRPHPLNIKPHNFRMANKWSFLIICKSIGPQYQVNYGV